MIRTSKQSGIHMFRSTAFILFFSLLSCYADAQQNPSKAQYQKIFSEVLSNFLSSQKADNICLPSIYFRPGADSIELTQRAVDLAPTAPTGQASQLKALEEAGLVTGASSERVVNNKPETFKTYRTTEKGTRYFSEGRLCYARAELNKLVKWKGPAVFGEYKIAWVYYTAKSTNVAEWATMPEILAAFPTVRSTLRDDPDKVRQVLIDLSSEGWEVNEWSKVLQ